jgi:hypothetical protein
VNGLLVPPLDIDAWSDALYRLVHEPTLVERLRANISPPRPMSQVAQEMLTVYQVALEKSKA